MASGSLTVASGVQEKCNYWQYQESVMTYEGKDREGLCNYHAKNQMLNVPMVFLPYTVSTNATHLSASIFATTTPLG